LFLRLDVICNRQSIAREREERREAVCGLSREPARESRINANSSWPQKVLVKKMNDQTVAAKDIGGGIVGTLVRFSWRCSACVSGLVALVAGALYWKVSCAQVMHKIQNFKIIYFAA